METKFEKLSDQLFEKQVENEKMIKIVGGITSQKYDTYVTINTDYQICGEDYRGRSCDPIVAL